MTTGAMAFRQGPDGHVGDADPGAMRRRRPARPAGLIPVMLAVLLCLAALLAAPVARAQQAPVVGTVAVQSKDIADSARFTGRVNAVNKVDILPRVDGFLLSLGFKEGQAVSDGQTLFEIEPDSYKAAITEIEGRIQAAEADKKLADIEVDRRIKFGIAELLHHVGPHDADLRRAMGDEGRHVEGAHANDRHVGPVGGKAQRPALLVMKLRLRLDTGPGKQRQRLIEDAPFGNGEGERTSHDAGHLGAGAQKGKVWRSRQNGLLICAS